MVSQIPPTQPYKTAMSASVASPVKGITDPVRLLPTEVASLSQIAQDPMAAIDATSVTPPSINASANAQTEAAPAQVPLSPYVPAVPADISNLSMDLPNPNVGVLNPPNKSDIQLSADTFEQKDAVPALKKLPKKGQTATNLVLAGKVAVCAIGAFYLGKGLAKIGKLLTR